MAKDGARYGEQPLAQTAAAASALRRLTGLLLSLEHEHPTVDAMLAGYADHPTPYLALFGIDPGPGYAEWLARRVPGAVVETWEDHGHYPHLVDPDRFVDRIVAFWAGSTGG